VSDRLPCLVPFCRRTAKRQPSDTDETEIICGKHYRLADKHRRRLATKIRRRYERATDAYRKRFLADLWWRNWEKIKAQVIERAMGC